MEFLVIIARDNSSNAALYVDAASELRTNSAGSRSKGEIETI